MLIKRYKPKVDRLFYIIWIPTLALLITATAIAAMAPIALTILIATDLFTLYFLISPLFGYAELRDETLFIKYGFILKREIPYKKIRAARKERKFYSESMLSLKCALDHINIKYNTFDITTVSLAEGDEFLPALEWKISKDKRR